MNFLGEFETVNYPGVVDGTYTIQSNQKFATIMKKFLPS